MTVNWTPIVGAASFLVGVGAAWGGMRVQVNGLRDTLKDISQKLDRQSAKLGELGERISCIEGKLNGD